MVIRMRATFSGVSGIGSGMGRGGRPRGRLSFFSVLIGILCANLLPLTIATASIWLVVPPGDPAKKSYNPEGVRSISKVVALPHIYWRVGRAVYDSGLKNWQGC